MVKKKPKDGNGQKTVRPALYARVSSEEQRERESIQTQIEVAQRTAEREGVKLIEVYKDDGVSSSIVLSERADGKRLLRDAKSGRFDVLWVYKLDRLERDTKSALIAAHYLESVGVTLRSLTEPFDNSTPAGRFMFSMLVSAAQLEKDNIRERAMDGTRRAMRNGRIAGGHVP
jgi:site-specific DNA recombinase